MSKSLTQAEKMTTSVKGCLNLFVTVISDIRDDKLTSVDLSTVELVTDFIGGMDGDQFLDGFIEQEAQWGNILTRNVKFIRETLPTLYEDAPFDVEILSVPFDVLEKLKKEGFKGSKDEDTWPLCQEDIDDIWSRFVIMVKIACNHVHLVRKPKMVNGKFTYSNPTAYKSFPLEKHVAAFDVKLLNTK